MKQIIIDIDDTILDLAPSLVRVFNNLTGKNLTVKDWTSYSVYELYGISREDYLAACTKENILHTAEPVTLAKEIIDRIKNKGYHIKFLTARGWHKDAHNITENWLINNGIYFDELHVVPFNKSKADYTIENWPNTMFDAIIDDNAHHIQDFIDKKLALQVFLINQPWNKQYKKLDIFRIDHIVRVLRHL